jgi:threonine/homoserine/homoserine lactone efflux protein
MAAAMAGLAIGVAVAAPIGPVGLLCIHRTLARGLMTGISTGFGFATTHALYGSLAAMGVSIAARGTADTAIHLLGALMILYTAANALRSRPSAPIRAAGRLQHVSSYATAVAFTLGNPTTLLAFALIVPGMANQTKYSQAEIAMLAAGIFAGSVGWWMTLSTGVAFARERITTGGLQVVNRITGVALAMSAVLLVVQAMRPMLG